MEKDKYKDFIITPENVEKLNYFEIKALLTEIKDIERCMVIFITKDVSYLDYIEDDEMKVKCFMELLTILEKKPLLDLYDVLNQVKDERVIRKYYKYLEYLFQKTRIICKLKSDELKADCILEFENDLDKCDIICSMKDTKLKLKASQVFDEDYHKLEVLKSIDDQEVRFDNMNLLKGNYYKQQLIATIKDDDLLLSKYWHTKVSLRLSIVKALQDDKKKIEFFFYFPDRDKVEIIKTFKDEKLKEEYALKPSLGAFRSDLIASLDNEEFIIDYFKKNPNSKFQINLIRKLKNNELKEKLANLLNNETYKTIALTNKEETKKEILSDYKLENINYNVDPKITIGVELEASGDESDIMLLINKILKNWEIKRDGSVHRGLEIASPILHFDSESLKQLKFICDFMNKNGFSTNPTCGGHIHFGFDYFETVDEFKTFLNLYSNIEDILYAISNKAGKIVRGNFVTYAKPASKYIKKLIVNEDRIESLGEYAKIVKDTQPSRYYALNTKNVGTNGKNTLEFRMPNGEIHFEEVLNNIRLFAKLLEVSKKITNNKDDLELQQIYEDILNSDNESKKLDLLLDMLFEEKEEQQIYHNRYKKNTSKIVKIMAKIAR